MKLIQGSTIYSFYGVALEGEIYQIPSRQQKGISNTIGKELEKGKEKQMLAFYMKESKELVLPNLDAYTSLLSSLIYIYIYIFFFFWKKKKTFVQA